MSERLIYLDNAATTPVHPEVWRAMEPYALELYGNPASAYAFAKKAEKAVKAARASLAVVIGTQPREIYFTSGGTESDNWALKAAAENGGHIITTLIEHHAVLNTCVWLEKRGVEITYLTVDEYGMVSPADVERAIRPDTALISVMTANNEIGTIQPIEEIGAIAKQYGIPFHTDAVQAFGHIPIDVNVMHIDILSASAHKLGGPKGVGMLYVRSGVELGSFLHGGAQERGLRAGTTNVPGAVGFAKAAEISAAAMKQNAAKQKALRDHLIGRIMTEISNVRLNGHPENRLAGNANFCFSGVEGETLLMHLSRAGICASSGSACAAGSEEPSHVLRAIGISDDIARGSLRLTLSEYTTKKDIDFAADELVKILEKLRRFSS